jgi:hypothetical protein
MTKWIAIRFGLIVRLIWIGSAISRISFDFIGIGSAFSRIRFHSIERGIALGV